MIFKFVLQHINPVLNTVLSEQEISEPIGWIESKIVLERDKNFASLVEHFTGEFIFYGDNGEENGGIDYIRAIERNGNGTVFLPFRGINAVIKILIFIAPDNYTFEQLFEGQLDLSTIAEMQDNKMQVAIIRDDFWAKFINRYDSQVNVFGLTDLDGLPKDALPPITLELTNQVLRELEEEDSGGLVPNDEGSYGETINIQVNDFFQVDFPNVVRQEIDQKYSLTATMNPLEPVSNFIVEKGGSYNIEVVIFAARVGAGITPLAPIKGIGVNIADFYLQIDGVRYTMAHSEAPYQGGIIDSTVSKFSISGVYNLKETSSIKIFGRANENFDDNPVIWIFSTAFERSRLKIEADTVYQSTKAEAIFTHDLAGSISDRITGVQDSFYSEYLGSNKTVYRSYPENGCAWPYVNIQGLQARGYALSEKQYSISMKKWFDGINPIIPISLMYDTIDGQPVIRVEDREFCYDATDTSVDINFVRDIVRKYDSDLMYKAIKIGYKKWESEENAGIDDPQTKRTYATRLKRTGIELTLESDFIAAGLTLENTRRTTIKKSADYKYDNDTFIVKVNPQEQIASPDTSPDSYVYIPEQDEDFTSVSNILNYSTRYNLRLTPARNFVRWLKFLSSTLFQYIGTTFIFTYGEGNYAMESTLVDLCEPNPETLAENQDIVSVNPVHLPFEYEFTDVPLDYDEYRLIAENRTKAIGISQTDENHTKFFIKKLEYDIVQGQANISAWPTTWMDIMVIEGEFALKDCNPDVLPDGCYRITEDGDFRITESGDYRILEDC